MSEGRSIFESEAGKRKANFLKIVGLAAILVIFILIIGGMVNSMKRADGDGGFRALSEFFDLLLITHALMWGGFLGSLPIACYFLNIFGCRRNQGIMQLVIVIFWLGAGAAWILSILANPQLESLLSEVGIFI